MLTGNRSSSLLKKPSQRPTVDDSIIYHESSGACMRGAFADQGGLFSYISPEVSWSRLSEQNLRVDKWSVCRG